MESTFAARLTAFLLALTLSFFILWIYRELGGFAALAVFVTTLLSPWITMFARNLLYFTWAFYLPIGFNCALSGMGKAQRQRVESQAWRAGFRSGGIQMSLRWI